MKPLMSESNQKCVMILLLGIFFALALWPEVELFRLRLQLANSMYPMTTTYITNTVYVEAPHPATNGYTNFFSTMPLQMNGIDTNGMTLEQIALIRLLEKAVKTENDQP